MNTSETSTTNFDKMCEIIIEANERDGVVWEQEAHWDMTLETIYLYQSNQLTDGVEDITVVNASFGDMLETMGLTDIGFDSYQHMLDSPEH